jgi:hypothetical protein
MSKVRLIERCCGIMNENMMSVMKCNGMKRNFYGAVKRFMRVKY